jgi:hypothetical protein
MSALARLGENGDAAQREDTPLLPRRHVLVRRSPGPFALRWALLTCLLLGCGDDAAGTPATTAPALTETPPQPPAAPPTPRPPGDPAPTPPGQPASDGAAADPGTPPDTTADGAAPTPPGGTAGSTPGTTPLDATAAGAPGVCTREDRVPLEVMPERGAPGLATEGTTLWVAGYRFDEGRERVQVMRVSAGRAVLEGELQVDPPLTQGRHAAPGLLHDGTRTLLAYTDGRGKLFVAALGGAPTLISELADIRLSPTLAKVAGGYAVTFTDSSGPTPRAILVRLNAELGRVAEHVLHPDYMGGTAPFLVREPDGSAHRVAFADPRRGLSTLLLATLGPDGVPSGEPVTVSVVSQLTDPARVVMAEARDTRRLHVGFTAVDARGATAVGHLFSNGPSNPRPLIQNRGYGVLDLDALGLPHGALFVVDSPLADPDTSPRELVVRLVDGQSFGEPLSLRSPDGTARAGRLARLADGTVMVAYTGLREIYVERLRCPDIAAPVAAPAPSPGPP